MSSKNLIIFFTIVLIILGALLVFKKNDRPTNETPPATSPPVGEYTPDETFYNFDSSKLPNNVSKIEIKNHNNDVLFKEIADSNFIDSANDSLSTAIKKNMNDEVYEKIASSQSEGNSITLSFILKDGTIYSTRVNLDLDIICINGEYYDVSPLLTQSINNQLLDVTEFNELNKPAPAN